MAKSIFRSQRRLGYDSVPTFLNAAESHEDRIPLSSRSEDKAVEKSEMNVRCVELVEGYGEWHVRVIEEDHEHTRSFEIESFALAYAEGQRRRLALADFTRI